MTGGPGQLTVAVDRIEGQTVMLEGDDGRRFSAGVKLFPERPREGLIYRVPLDAAGKPLWPQAVADRDEMERRRKDLDSRMNRLRRDDPGGDTKL